MRTAADPPDRDLFRKAILSSAAADLVCVVYSEGSAKNKADFHTNNSRKIGLGYGIALHQCNFCHTFEGLAGGPLLTCPCRVAVYCSKECQVSDWKVHKKFCPDLAKKKKQKMKQQQQEQKDIDIEHEIPATFCGNAVQSCNSCTALETPDGGELLKCPCRTACYCSKECQRSHWMVHKKVCPGAVADNTMQSCNSCTAWETPDGGDLLKCPCRTAFYCSKECQRSHWEVHKKVCPGAVGGNPMQSCNSCTAFERPDGGDLLKCSCRTAFYCTKECQRSHWMGHKQVCPDFAKKKNHK